jgi:hypothetical protein
LGRINPPNVFEYDAPIVEAIEVTIADGRDIYDDPESRRTLSG